MSVNELNLADRSLAQSAPPRTRESRARRPAVLAVLAAVVATLSVALTAAVAQAHGPIAPVASSYEARVSIVPPGLHAQVVDGDLRMWLRVPPRQTVVVLDYRAAPYLRFSPRGVEVNQNSAMFYLNMTPVAETPPANLTRGTPPRWAPVSGSHAYEWHDGRLHALATVALLPGQSYVGRWMIPVLIDGRPQILAGGVWHANDPSIVWFWPIAVMLICLLAGLRLGDSRIDGRIAKALGIAALTAIVVVGIGRQLHGRPTVTPFQLVELAGILAFAGWALVRVLSGHAGYFTYFLIAFVALLEGAETVTTLLYGFVLLPLPAVVARIATVLCLGCGASLMVLVFRLASRRDTAAPGRADEEDFDALGSGDDDAWELA